MRAAFNRIDVIGEGEDGFIERVGILHRNFNDDIVFFALKIDHIRVHWRFVAVQMLDKFQYAAVILEDFVAAGGFFPQRDFCAAIQEGQFAQTSGEDIPLEAGLVRENGMVGHEGDLRAGFASLSDSDQISNLNTALETLVVDLAATFDFNFQPFRERIHTRNTDSMQPARYLIGVGIKLTAGVQYSQNNRNSRLAFGWVHIDRNTATVVNDAQRAVFVNTDFNVGAIACKCLVNRVIDDFVYTVMVASGTRVANIHGGTFPDGIHALKHGNMVGTVAYGIGIISGAVLRRFFSG